MRLPAFLENPKVITVVEILVLLALVVVSIQMIDIAYGIRSYQESLNAHGCLQVVEPVMPK